MYTIRFCSDTDKTLLGKDFEVISSTVSSSDDTHELQLQVFGTNDANKLQEFFRNNKVTASLLAEDKEVVMYFPQIYLEDIKNYSYYTESFDKSRYIFTLFAREALVAKYKVDQNIIFKLDDKLLTGIIESISFKSDAVMYKVGTVFSHYYIKQDAIVSKFFTSTYKKPTILNNICGWKIPSTVLSIIAQPANAYAVKTNWKDEEEVLKGSEEMLKIENVYVNKEKRIITVKWNNGRIIQVTCDKEDTWDLEKGVAVAIAKYFMGKNLFKAVEMAEASERLGHGIKKQKTSKIEQIVKECRKKHNKDKADSK